MKYAYHLMLNLRNKVRSNVDDGDKYAKK